MLQISMSTLEFDPQNPEPSTFRYSMARTVQRMIFGFLIDHGEFDQRSSAGRQMAVFDIDDGQTLVLTPFQLPLESVPRPCLRGMGVSWLVENAGDTKFR